MLGLPNYPTPLHPTRAPDAHKPAGWVHAWVHARRGIAHLARTVVTRGRKVVLCGVLGTGEYPAGTGLRHWPAGTGLGPSGPPPFIKKAQLR